MNYPYPEFRGVPVKYKPNLWIIVGEGLAMSKIELVRQSLSA
jgi:hypothetical protein